MAARPSFSNDSRIVKMPLQKSVLLKDYLLDDLSSCSSNGFRSYPRRQCCTKVRYLIEIDLNKHIKLPQSQKQFLKLKSKSKLHKASAAVVNVFKRFQFTSSGNAIKPNFLIRNLSRKLSNRGFWKRSSEKMKEFDESIKQKKNIIPPPEKASAPVIAVTATAGMKTVVSNFSNSTASSESYFTGTSDSSITAGYSDINVAKKHAVKNTVGTVTATNVTGNEKKQWKNEEKDQFSPVSVMDFPFDDEDEVTSPFKHNHLYPEGSNRKLMYKVQRTKSLAQLKPVRLEDRIMFSESKTNDFKLETEKKAIALLQLLKTTLPNDLSESNESDNVLLGFFIERINDGNVSNYDTLQEAKDWVNNRTKEMFESQDYKLTCIRDMEKVKWLKYDSGVGKEEVGLELEYEVFTSLVEEMFLDFYL